MLRTVTLYQIDSVSDLLVGTRVTINCDESNKKWFGNVINIKVCVIARKSVYPKTTLKLEIILQEIST